MNLLKNLIFTVLLLLTLLTVSVNLFAQESSPSKCLKYEPEVVTVEGTLTRGTFVNALNEKKTAWLLKLDRPVCVDADANNEFNEKAENQARFQLVLTAEQIKAVRPLLNKKVTLSGTLFHAHTQHHFTDVLLIAEEISAN